MATQVELGLDVSAEAGFVRGHAKAILGLNAMVEQIAQTQIGVLLLGESGTGKEAYARWIHRLSAQAHLQMGKVSCTALEPEQLQSHVARHLLAPANDLVQGAPGTGTLFLDGIDELDLTCQKVLLSLLPDESNGDTGEKPLRLISSASRNLDHELESGKFRPELYFRVSGVCLRLPPLRERREDIHTLLEHFLLKHASDLKRQVPLVGRDEMEFLVAYDWPGNIRELANLAQKMVALGDPKIAIEDLGAAARLMKKTHEHALPSSLKTAARLASRHAERELILKALERTHWNRKRAAQELQISYKSLLYKIKQTGVDGSKVEEQ